MAPAPAPAPAPSRGDNDTDVIHHLWCCDPSTALCGTDVSGDEEETPEAGLACVVCVDLKDKPCPICGAC